MNRISLLTVSIIIATSLKAQETTKDTIIAPIKIEDRLLTGLGIT